MTQPSRATQMSRGLLRISYSRALLWLTLAVMWFWAATSSAVWDVQAAASAPPGGTVPPVPACSGGRLIARPDVVGTTSSSSVQLLPLQNDMVVPPKLTSTASISLTQVSTPTHGSVTWMTVDVTTTVTYTPEAEFTGADVFTYTVTDQCGRSATGRMVVIVFRDDLPAQPAIITRPLTPGQGVTQNLNLPVSATLTIPAEIFTETDDETDLHHFVVADLGQLNEEQEAPPAPGLRFMNVALSMDEFRNNDEVESPVFSVPLILEIAFDLANAAGEEPELFYWHAEHNEWRKDGIERLAYDPESGVATFAIYHLTDFAVFTETSSQQMLFLPNLTR